MRIDMSWDGSNRTTSQKRRYETELSLFERNIVRYTRNYSVRPSAKPVDPFVPFMMAVDGLGYEDPKTGDIRVRTGENYIVFRNSGAVASDVVACVGNAWPSETRASWAVDVDISLKVWRNQC
jgi:hypothetical protein